MIKRLYSLLFIFSLLLAGAVQAELYTRKKSFEDLGLLAEHKSIFEAFDKNINTVAQMIEAGEASPNKSILIFDLDETLFFDSYEPNYMDQETAEVLKVRLLNPVHKLLMLAILKGFDIYFITARIDGTQYGIDNRKISEDQLRIAGVVNVDREHLIMRPAGQGNAAAWKIATRKRLADETGKDVLATFDDTEAMFGSSVDTPTKHTGYVVWIPHATHLHLYPALLAEDFIEITPPEVTEQCKS